MMVGEISAIFQQMLSVNKRPLVPASMNKLVSLSDQKININKLPEVSSQVEEDTTGTRAYSRVVMNAHSQIGPLFEQMEHDFYLYCFYIYIYIFFFF